MAVWINGAWLMAIIGIAPAIKAYDSGAMRDNVLLGPFTLLYAAGCYVWLAYMKLRFISQQT